MTKKKKASSHAKSSLEFPLDVLRAKESLKNKRDKHFSVIKKLTESENPDTLKKMWISLEKAKNKKRGAVKKSTDNLWPHFFVSMVASYSVLPSYYYQTKSQRKKLLEDLKKYSGHLIEKLQRHGLDYHLAHSDQRNVLDIYERMDFLDD